MKKYSIPVMDISKFEIENVVTESAPVASAFEDAKEAAYNIDGTKRTFTVKFVF